MGIIAKTFEYKARNKKGSVIEGLIEAEDQNTATAMLKRRGYYVSSLEEQNKKDDILATINDKLQKMKGVSLDDLSIFCRQFSTMINSGLSLVRSLDILVEQTENPNLREAVVSLKEGVQSGKTLSDAMKEQGKVFPELFISMVEAGEAGGVLDHTLAEMSEHFEKESELRQRVKSATTYPAAIIVVAVGVVFFLMTFVIPEFVAMFAGSGMELPLPTQIVMGVSDFLAAFWWTIILGVLALVIAVKKYYETENGRRQIDWLLLHIPVIGDMLLKMSVTRFSKTLAILLGSGVSILHSFKVVSNVMTNQIIADRLFDARKKLSEGESIVLPLEQDDLFPPMVLQMLRVGEETGNLDEMLLTVAKFYEREVESAVDAVVDLIEPAIIVVLGGVVGGIVVAIAMPMFQMMDTI